MKSAKTIIVLLIAAASTFAQPDNASAAERRDQLERPGTPVARRATPADWDGERELAFLLAPIHSNQDLAFYLDEIQNQRGSRSPLSRLSRHARQRFLDSLVFTENGLGGYYYADLAAELSATEAYQLLSLFGAQHTTRLLKGVRVQSKADQLIMNRW